MHNNTFMRNSKVQCSLFLSLLSLILSACTLPNNGPRSTAFEANAFDKVGVRVSRFTHQNHEKIAYVLVDVDSDIVKKLENYDNQKFLKNLPERYRPSANIKIGIGDIISITIYEASSGGLFIPKNASFTGGNFVKIPNQEVDKLGQIKMPYVGTLQVSGRSSENIEKEIEKKLVNRAIEPQVVVSVVKRTSNLVTVLGDVKSAGRFNINPISYKILDAIGSAGGSRYQDFETEIVLQRKGRKNLVRMSDLTYYPNNNIQVQLGDSIFLQRKQQFFSLFGAVKKPGEFIFDRSSMTVANALAKGEGLIDERADPYTIVIYRLENRKLLKKYGAKIPNKYKGAVPTVYRFNLRDADGFFFAKHFKIRNYDLAYVANSPWIDALKINSIIRDYADTIRGSRGIVETFATKIPEVALIKN